MAFIEIFKEIPIGTMTRTEALENGDKLKRLGQPSS
jgi:hypothetical protein